MSLRKDIQAVINRHSAENGSNTPDFILARYLDDCLASFDRAVIARAAWYGQIDTPVTDYVPGPKKVCRHDDVLLCTKECFA